MKPANLFHPAALKLSLIGLINRLLPFFILKRLPLATVVNEERVRSSIKRIFSNSMKEVLGEIFQNSQRAGARRVVITTRANGFSVSDDGSGISGIQGFHALLKIAESQYEAPSVEADQKPMGVGLLSLLSFEKVSRVTFISGDLELEVDTNRWFEDERYYRAWFKRLKSSARRVQGLTIAVECPEEVVKQLKDTLKATDSYREASPAQGYGGILEIDLDGAAVETRLPRWARITRTLVETEYLGSRLVIGFTDDGTIYRSSTVNWFGQLIKFDFSESFTVHLEVRQGHPVNPRSPVREGLIANEAFKNFIAFAKDTLFRYLFAPENRDVIQPAWVIAYYKLDKERAMSEAPYYVASPRNEINGPGSVEDTDTTGELELLSYEDAEQPLLLKSRVALLIEKEAGEGEQLEEVDYGLCSFIPQIGKAYKLECGNQKKLSIGRLYWRPGTHLSDFFYEAGEYGISFNGALPASFSPVTADNVFIFRYTANWDPEEAEFVAVASDQISFLYTYAWAAFCWEHDEASANELEESYESSVKRMVRDIMGNCVSSTFSLYDLTPFFTGKESRVKSILVIYNEKGTAPSALAVTSDQGETVNLSLLY